MLKLERTGFADGLDVERERGLKINSKNRMTFSQFGKIGKDVSLTGKSEGSL